MAQERKDGADVSAAISVPDELFADASEEMESSFSEACHQRAQRAERRIEKREAREDHALREFYDFCDTATSGIECLDVEATL